MAQLDARPTGAQAVAGSTHGIMKYFLRHSLPFADSRRAVIIFWRMNAHNTA